MKSKVSILAGIAISTTVTLFGGPAISDGAVMNDYCITPPYLVAGIKPNLLLMIDNSSSMYDMAYTDKGTATRQPVYCYDQTYSSANTYYGYFDSAKSYEYDLTNDYFFEVASFPASCSPKHVADTLCVEGVNIGTSTTPKTVTRFVAKGNYLNWLTASKFDAEKQILTGGKYDATNYLYLAESRGCIGRRYVKEALTANYVEGGTNTSLAITFGVRGPSDPADPTQPSPGGQTYIDIFDGNYNEAACDQAVDDITAGQLGAAKTSVKACLAYPSGASQEAKEGTVFNQSLQACMALYKGTALDTDDVNTVVKQCTDVYAYYGNNPATIPMSSPAYLCNSTYVGKCYDKDIPGTDRCTSDDLEQGLIKTQGGAWDIDIQKGVGVVCGKACIIDRHEAFCGQVKVPPVTDPTEDPANTTNVPAILSDTGVLAQLDLPLFTGKGTCSVSGTACTSDAGCTSPQKCVSNGLSVRIYNTTSPTGLVQEFASLIRTGAMAFNYNGSKTENTLMIPPANTVPSIPSPLVCSGNTSRQCMSDKDCSLVGSGTCTVADSTNKDGGRIIHYIGKGTCSVTTSTECATDAHCPSGEVCVSSGVGSHAAGLVKTIDDIRASSWTPFAEAFYNAIGYFAKDPSDSTGKTSRTDLRLDSDDFLAARNPSQYKCQSNSILLVTDGMSTADRENSNVTGLAALYNDGDGETTSSATAVTACPGYMGSKNLDDLAWLAKNRKISVFSKTSPASTTAPVDKRDFIKTYVVNSGAANGAAGECNPATLMQQTATNGGGNYYTAADPPALRTSLRQALTDISAGVSSGTAASILSNSEGSGANILQALFYPLKYFSSNTQASWIGEMQNLWYYVDPFIGNSTIRENTSDPDPPPAANTLYLHLKSDNVVHYYFVSPDTKAKRYRDSDGNGSGDTFVDDVFPDDVKSIWRAGNQLWARDLSSSPRTIKTHVDGVSLINFSLANASTLQPYLQAAASPSLEADKVVKYVHGIDLAKLPTTDTYYDANYRSRTVTTRNFKTGVTETHVWKLGDIISSTPRLQSSVPLNTHDRHPPVGYDDSSYSAYTDTTAYKNRGMAYVGANDGMLHAFKLGVLDVTEDGDRKATLTGTGLGDEAWAFIPKSALPYLKYLADPNYSHLYLVDGTSLAVDASICGPTECSGSYWNAAKTDSSWRTVLIGGMGLGGASRNLGDLCDNTASGTCVETPIDGVGYSSYYALDVTTPSTPQLLWEYSDPQLGYATTGPAIVRASSKKADGSPDNEKNGRWFVVFASGPTGAIDTTKGEFLGKSDQNLKIFVRDIKTGATTIYNTGIANAFAGSLSGGVLDTDRLNKNSNGYYQDDALYLGYVRKCTATDTGCTVGEWTKGGVLRLIITDAYNPDAAPNFSGTFKVSKVIDGIGPVTSAITKLQDKKYHKLWLYFGTGRYYRKQDDSTGRRRLYGVQEPCYKATVTRSGGQTTTDDIDDTASTTCDDNPWTLSDLADQTAGTSDSIGTSKGWYITLDAAGTPTGYDAERVVTDPVATTNGAVFFTSFKPAADICSFGGNSHLWAVKYDTGYKAPAAALKGKALIQLSTGEFKEIDLKDILGDGTAAGNTATKQGRRLESPMTGKSSTDSAPIVTNSNLKPKKKILQIQEK